jgi:hypothetical protein
MIRFLVFYLLIYGAAHYYAFCKVRAAFPLKKRVSIPIVLFMVLMVLAPIIVRFAERFGFEIGARSWSYMSFTWMGLLFFFVTISAGIDCVRFVIFLAGKVQKKDLILLKISPQKLFTVQALLVLAIYGYGLFEANNIRTEYLVIKSPKISAKQGKVRIAQISDVHLGLIVRERYLQKILDIVAEAKPDLLVSTGDLVDGQLNNLTGEEKLLAAIRPRLGKIAITGNHEFYAGLEASLDFIKKAGFTILRHKGITLQGLNIVGIDDQASEAFGIGYAESERDVLFAQPNKNFTVFLKHRPDVDPQSLGLFDLQLSGHTHKGQIFPFNLLTWFFHPRRAGHTKLMDGDLYVSRGTGTWGPPIRFLAPPEVTIIDLIHGKAKESSLI